MQEASQTLRNNQKPPKTIPAYLEDERQKRKGDYCGRKQKLRASSRCAMATIARRNSQSWNCHLELKRHPRRGKLQQQLGKNRGPRERR